MKEPDGNFYSGDTFLTVYILKQRKKIKSLHGDVVVEERLFFKCCIYLLRVPGTSAKLWGLTVAGEPSWKRGPSRGSAVTTRHEC